MWVYTLASTCGGTTLCKSISEFIFNLFMVNVSKSQLRVVDHTFLWTLLTFSSLSSKIHISFCRISLLENLYRILLPGTVKVSPHPITIWHWTGHCVTDSLVTSSRWRHLAPRLQRFRVILFFNFWLLVILFFNNQLRVNLFAKDCGSQALVQSVLFKSGSVHVII